MLTAALYYQPVDLPLSKDDHNPGREIHAMMYARASIVDWSCIHVFDSLFNEEINVHGFQEK